MTKLPAILIALALTGCGGLPRDAEITTYRERVDVCVTTIVPSVDIATRRPFFWRYHRCEDATDTITAGAVVSPSVVESLSGAAGTLGAGWLVGDMIGPSPKTISIGR